MLVGGLWCAFMGYKPLSGKSQHLWERWAAHYITQRDFGVAPQQGYRNSTRSTTMLPTDSYRKIIWTFTNASRGFWSQAPGSGLKVRPEPYTLNAEPRTALKCSNFELQIRAWKMGPNPNKAQTLSFKFLSPKTRPPSLP